MITITKEDKFYCIDIQNKKIPSFIIKDDSVIELMKINDLKSFMNYSSENEKIVGISCGFEHSLALTESGRIFGWGDNECGALGFDDRYSCEPIIIDLNLKI